MVLAQFVIQPSSSVIDRAPRARIYHPFSGRRVRMRVIQTNASFHAVGTEGDIPYRIDMDTFQSQTLGTNALIPEGAVGPSDTSYRTIVPNASGFGLILGNSTTTEVVHVYGTEVIMEGFLIGNTLTATLQMANKLPGDYAVVPVDLTETTLAYVILYVDIEPI